MSSTRSEKNSPDLRQNGLVYRCAQVSGILLLVVSVLHGVLGLNEILAAIRVGDIGKDAAAMITIGWIFSGASLFLAGSWILFLSKALKRLERKAWWQGLFVSGLLIVLGGGCWRYFPSALFLLGFMALGLLLFIPLLLCAGQYLRR